MEQIWYYEDHGRAKGPVSTRDLVNRIQKGEMTLMDLVFKEGAPQWMPAESFSEITELIGNVTLNDSSDWIVLKTVNVDGKNVHQQIGPYNAQQILDLIDKGKIRFSDYVWRTGYEKWVPLGRVDQFEKPLKSSVEVDLSLYTKPRDVEHFIESVPVKKVTVVPVAESTVREEPKPIEAKGDDLAAAKWKIPATEAVKVNVVVHNEPVVKKEPVVTAKEKPVEPPIEPKVTAPPASVQKIDPPREAAPVRPQNEERVPVEKHSARGERSREKQSEKPTSKSTDKPVERVSVATAPVKEIAAEKKKNTAPPARATAAPLPELPSTKAQVVPSASKPEPVEDLEVDMKKPHRPTPPQQRSAARTEAPVVASQKQEAPPLPTAKKVASAPMEERRSSAVEKIAEVPKANEAVVEKISSAKEEVKKEKVEEVAVVSEEQRKATQRRWMQVGVAACVVVIACASGILFFIGKQKISNSEKGFSIKLDPPTVATPEGPSLAERPPAPKNEKPKVVTQVKPAEEVKKGAAAKPVVGQKPIAKVDAKPAETTAKEESTAPTISGSFKNRSYYHHKERIYLFYTSNEGEQLASDLQKASKKHQKSSKSWKSFYGSWKGKAKSYTSKVGREAKKARLHRTLFRQLATSASELEDLGRDFNTQISTGRGPANVASAKSLETQFKSIRTNARSLDR